MTAPLPEERLLSAATARNRDGWLVVTYAGSSFLATLINWLIAVGRAGIDNTLVVALDRRVYDFLLARGFTTVLVEGRALKDIRIVRVRVMQFLVQHGFSVIQSDADAVWLRDPRAFFENGSASIVASEGTYWPEKAYQAWGFVLCTGLYSIRSEASTNALLDRWLPDLHETGSDQASLNRLLLADGVTWDTSTARPEVRQFRERRFTSFDAPISGACPGAGLSLRLLPHALFQRAPVEAHAPYVVHYLPDLAKLPETQALTTSGSWFLASDWKRIEFDANTLERVAVYPKPRQRPWTQPQVGRSRNRYA